MASARKSSVRIPTKKRGHPQTNPRSLANLRPPWKKGDPSPNPSGKPKILGEAYKAKLARVMETDPEKRTYAELIADGMIVAAMGGDVSAAREVRAATEGERIRTWRDDVIDLLKAGTVSTEQVENELGHELARELFIAAGIRRDESGETQSAGGGTKTRAA